MGEGWGGSESKPHPQGDWEVDDKRHPQAEAQPAHRSPFTALGQVVQESIILTRRFDPIPEVEITPSFKYIDGGVTTIIEALRAHDEDDARDFLDIYDELSVKDKKVLKLEEIACAVPLSALRLAEIIQTAVVMYGKLTTSFLLSSSMHKVVATSLKQAVKPSGLADREWMLKAGGVLPTPKGAQIAIQNNMSEREDRKAEAVEAVYLDPGREVANDP